MAPQKSCDPSLDPGEIEDFSGKIKRADPKKRASL